MPSSAVQTCALDRKSTRLNSSHTLISYAVFCLKKEQPAQARPLAPPDLQCPVGQGDPARARRFLRSRIVPGSRVPGRLGPAPSLSFFLMIRRPPRFTLFPSTPLFR